jgi:hypothetical protein
MLTESQVEWVVQLLCDNKLSHREIARQTRVSRGTISAIARGDRPHQLHRKPADEAAFDPGPPARCRGCGGLVQMPCLLCRIRACRAIELRMQELAFSGGERDIE